MKIVDFPDFCRIWHLGGFGCMENTPTGCADDLPTILEIFKKIPKIEKRQHFFQRLDFAPNSINKFIYQPKLRPVSQDVGKKVLGPFR